MQKNSSGSKIEWTGDTVNLVVGCSLHTEGCRNCYAVLQANRQQGMGTRGYQGVVKRAANETLHWSGTVNTVPTALRKPLNLRKPQTYFVNSMSDLFHEKVPFEFIAQVFYVMAFTPQHTYQILTKRPENMAAFFQWLSENPQALCLPDVLRDKYPHTPITVTMPLGNVWLDVSVENKKAKPHIEALRSVPAAKRFLSCEPLLEDLDLQVDELAIIDWIIVGGESGKHARPMQPEWAESIIKMAKCVDIPLFFKQWGAYGEDRVKRHKAANGHLFRRVEIREMPA